MVEFNAIIEIFEFLHDVGTTDNACEVTDYPQPTEKEVQFILKEIRNYLSPDVRGETILNFLFFFFCFMEFYNISIISLKLIFT